MLDRNPHTLFPLFRGRRLNMLQAHPTVAFAFLIAVSLIMSLHKTEFSENSL